MALFSESIRSRVEFRERVVNMGLLRIDWFRPPAGGRDLIWVELTRWEGSQYASRIGRSDKPPRVDPAPLAARRSYVCQSDQRSGTERRRMQYLQLNRKRRGHGCGSS